MYPTNRFLQLSKYGQLTNYDISVGGKEAIRKHTRLARKANQRREKVQAAAASSAKKNESTKNRSTKYEGTKTFRVIYYE